MSGTELACSRSRVAHNVRVVKRVWAGLHLLFVPRTPYWREICYSGFHSYD
jgi:hypothetical protein